MKIRVGVGFDAHPFALSGQLRLGGVVIPHGVGLEGHSDGDALLHAITDAILGAAGRGSIGDHFPSADPAWKGADSTVFLERAQDLAREKGLVVGNIDAVVIAESPRIAPHAAKIASRIAEVLGVDPDAVSVRGTSTNHMGFAGRAEGLAVIAVVLLNGSE
ncbi:MAG TPA: 2-C-methyl-D-erythritol 2,4-cyclodiphosphate synthase [Thermoanaerobaculia bacterium]|jgi:2-C-methyl-D-erythritol 2,4-cyclodiphosphate synthase|nr:2-C-methyl-D-erythritol 2,4-cyclodiphosphate synthase [Thermoanaerobaculia bacterium]